MPPETEIPQGTAIQLIASASLANLNQNKATLEELAKTYTGLTIAGIADKDGYKLLKKGVGELRTARTSIEKLRKEEKANILAAGKIIDDAANTLTGIITPVEEAGKTEIARIDLLIEAEEERKREELENKKQARISLLFETGLSFSGTHYKIGELSITPLQVAEYSQSQFEGFIAQANVEFEALQMAKQEEEERLEAERQENKRKQEAAERQAEEDRLKAVESQRQADQLIAERTEGRISTLATLGFETAEATNGGYFGVGNYFISLNAIKTAGKDQWAEEVKEYTAHKAQIEEDEAEFVASMIQPVAEEKPVTTFQHPPKSDPIGDPRMIELAKLGFQYVSTADAFIKNGVQIRMINIQTMKEDAWQEMFATLPALIADGEKEIDHVLSNQAEQQAAYFDTRPYQATIMFSTDRPFMDTKIGKATLRIYVEEFLEPANDSLPPANIIDSGSLGDSPDLLFLLFKS